MRSSVPRARTPPPSARLGSSGAHGLPVADRLYGNARIAYHAARQLNPQANEWYREADGAALRRTRSAWRVRAALRVAAWRDVLRGDRRHAAAEAQEAAWRYWRARALAATGRDAEARALYTALAGEIQFLRHARRRGAGRRRARAAEQPLAADRRGAGGVRRARRDVRRAVKLAQLDMRPESQREWIYIVRGLDDDALLLAAEYARREASTIARSTPRSAPRRATTSRCAT